MNIIWTDIAQYLKFLCNCFSVAVKFGQGIVCEYVRWQSLEKETVSQ